MHAHQSCLSNTQGSMSPDIHQWYDATWEKRYMNTKQTDVREELHSWIFNAARDVNDTAVFGKVTQSTEDNSDDLSSRWPFWTFIILWTIQY